MSQSGIVPMTLEAIFSALHAKDRAWLQAQLTEKGHLDFEAQLYRAAGEDQQLEKLASQYEDGTLWLNMTAPNQSVPFALKEAIREELLNLASDSADVGDPNG